MSTPQLATFHEMQTIYSIDDCLDMHEALDLYEAATKKAENKSNKNNNKVVIDGGVK